MNPKDCVFCQKDQEEIYLENDLAKAFYDYHPVQQGHSLIVPKRHVEAIWDLTGEELTAIWELVGEVKTYLDDKYQPGGYNIGVNAGPIAGQSVMHCHVHLIPRYHNVPLQNIGIEKLIPTER